MTYVQPHLIQAHAQLIHASPAQRRPSTPAQPSEDWKVTGTNRSIRPDDESVWIERTGQWQRKWLPGEKEAEAQRRVGDVKNEQMQEMFDYRLSAEQKNELAKINSAMEDARRSGRFSDDELNELERQATAQRMGIRPLPVPREEPPKPVFHTDEDGQRWIMNGQKWEPVQKEKPEKPKDDFAALLKLTPETRTEMKRNPATGRDEPVEVPLSMDERLAEMEKIRQMRDKFNAGTPGTGDDPVVAMQAMQAANPLAPFAQIFAQPAGAEQQAAAPAPAEDGEFAQFLRK